MCIGLRPDLVDLEFLQLVIDYSPDVETYGPFDCFAKGLCSHGPAGREPTGGTLHSHAKLREATPIRGYRCGPEGTGKVFSRDAGSVIPYGYARRRCGINLNFYFEF